MANKKIIIGVTFAIAILAVGAGTFIFLRSASEKNKESSANNSSQGSSKVASLKLNKASAIPLNETNQNSQNDPNALKVNNKPSSNPASMGSGVSSSRQNSNSSTSNSSSNSSIPGPESFGQYDQYKNGQTALFGDLQVGTGSEVVAGKNVVVYYKGWLTNGQLFDQSVEKTFTFTVGAKQVIPGWEQAIIGMKVGGVRRMIIPPSVGYGSQAQGPIPANSVLVFDVQLEAVN